MDRLYTHEQMLAHRSVNAPSLTHEMPVVSDGYTTQFTRIQAQRQIEHSRYHWAIRAAAIRAVVIAAILLVACAIIVSLELMNYSPQATMTCKYVPDPQAKTKWWLTCDR